ncbi:GlxA family transcriptional regulator [Yoonia maritima]|uniref:GlxA family transcriptional regulator n=1 Tax=Yoonia maritima TaxID=1435347 RepID=UPI000D10576D|nr:DJ-1/PfpI family protein [Yoonia maritima]
MDNTDRRIDVLLYDGVNAVDVTGAAQVFSSATDLADARYAIRYVSMAGDPVQSSCGLRLMADAAFDIGSDADDLIVPGGQGVDRALECTPILDLIAGWQSRDGRRVISVCSGALLLAKAGLLNGRVATTHWRRTSCAVSQFPDVDWQIDRLYCCDGTVMTAAGVTSGIDLALAILRKDHGDDTALQVAREMVVYLHRPGGQHQFADVLTAQFAQTEDLRVLVDAMVDNPQHEWTLDQMADVAFMTPRTLTRRFAAGYGLSPVKFLERIRVKLAEAALGAGAPVAHACTVAGFRDFQQMQRAFKRHNNTTVGEYRKRFGPNTRA